MDNEIMRAMAFCLSEIINKTQKRIRSISSTGSGLTLGFPAFTERDIHKVLKEISFQVLEKTFIQVEEVARFADGISGNPVLRFHAASSNEKMILKYALNNTNRLRRELAVINGLPDPSRRLYPNIYFAHETKVESQDCLLVFMEDFSSDNMRLDEFLRKNPKKLAKIAMQLATIYKKGALSLPDTEFHLARFLNDRTQLLIKRHYFARIEMFSDISEQDKSSLRRRIETAFTSGYQPLLDPELRAEGYFIHGDLHIKNIFYDTMQQKIRLIDPIGDPQVASPVYDLGTFCASAVIAHHSFTPQPPRALDNLVSDWHQLRELAGLGWYTNSGNKTNSASAAEVRMLWAATLCFALIPSFRISRWSQLLKMVAELEKWVHFQP